jgi:hypothetical protein
MSLSSVFVHVGVNELDDVITNGCGEDGGEGDLLNNLRGTGLGVNAHNGSGGHLI